MIFSGRILDAIDSSKTEFELEKIKTKILLEIAIQLHDIKNKKLIWK